VGPWDLEASLIPHDYVRAVEEAGGRPLLVPPSENGLEETLDALDRIVFSGGSDLDPEHYGAEAHPETSGIHEERDRAELELMKAALERDMPVLGICRVYGAQTRFRLDAPMECPRIAQRDKG
jgi:gamma-glutamyl-gamma-aminobutyrate hydrolase PuuD